MLKRAVVHAASVIRNQRYSDAVNLLLRYAAACDASNAKSSQCRAYLGAVVVQLYAENATEAWQIYQVALMLHWTSGVQSHVLPRLGPLLFLSE